jgi:hypothetical protein
MDLFAARGIELEESRRGGSPSKGSPLRTPRVPLLKPNVVNRALGLGGFSLSIDQRKVAEAYANKARSPRFVANETAVRDVFVADILGTVLGYVPYDPDPAYTIARERSTRGGPVDVALGRFPGPDGQDEFVAPFELKGPKTRDLDAIMPGRGRSPVQQAWDYASYVPGAR